MNLELIQTSLKYKFKNKNLLTKALTHTSFDRFDKQNNYERLELLGDTVLGMIITEYLLNIYQHDTEGMIAKRRAFLVSGSSLAVVANNIAINSYIIMSDGEDTIGGRCNNNILADVIEAIIGAIYLDGGLEQVRNFILSNWSNLIQQVDNIPISPKTFLQEWSQKQGLSIPEYNIVGSHGPDHAPVFEVEVTILNYPTVKAVGSSKKNAEVNAAKLFIEQLIDKNGK